MKIRNILEKYIKAKPKIALIAKRNIYRQFYSNIRNLTEDINEIDYLISIQESTIDDEEQQRIMILEREIYKELLLLFGQPLYDPEHKKGDSENGQI